VVQQNTAPANEVRSCRRGGGHHLCTFGTLTALRGPGLSPIQEATAHPQITPSQRYVHWARGLAAHAGAPE
jgi:hypothetical protein